MRVKCVAKYQTAAFIISLLGIKIFGCYPFESKFANYPGSRLAYFNTDPRSNAKRNVEHIYMLS